jgi:hypothetical protein
MAKMKQRYRLIMANGAREKRGDIASEKYRHIRNNESLGEK